MNQYTETPFDDSIYDANGNLLTWDNGPSIDSSATYDYRNQMISTTDDVTDTTTSYRHDALGRRATNGRYKGISTLNGPLLPLPLCP